MATDGPGSANFSVDLAALSDAIVRMKVEHEIIGDNVGSLVILFGKIQNHWHSPASQSFYELTAQFATVTGNFQQLLSEAIDKMTTAHQNYQDAEQTNTANYQKNLIAAGNQPPPDGNPNQPSDGNGGNQSPDANTGNQSPDANGGAPVGGKPTGGSPGVTPGQLV